MTTNKNMFRRLGLSPSTSATTAYATNVVIEELLRQLPAGPVRDRLRKLTPRSTTAIKVSLPMDLVTAVNDELGRPVYYTLTFEDFEGGSVTVDPATYADGVLAGSDVTLTAEPDTGYEFTGWGDDGSDNPLEFTMDADKHVAVEFSQLLYTLDVTASNGSVDRAPDQASYVYGTEVQLTATPDDGYEFDGWSGDASGGNPTTVVVDGDKSVEATFTEVPDEPDEPGEPEG